MAFSGRTRQISRLSQSKVCRPSLGVCYLALGSLSVFVLSHFCSVRLWTSWTLAHQAPLSIGFPRQEYCSGVPFPPPGDLPNPGIKPASPVDPALAGGFFIT